MNTGDIARSLATLFSELVRGAASGDAFMLNGGDPGLLAALDRIDARAASARHGGSSVAAHVDHLRYGLSLMNRWAQGENPFPEADWAASWERTTVDEHGWQELRAALREETERWLATLATPREVAGIELSGMIGSIAHLAYHLGAIRQMEYALAGPPATA